MSQTDFFFPEAFREGTTDRGRLRFLLATDIFHYLQLFVPQVNVAVLSYSIDRGEDRLFWEMLVFPANASQLGNVCTKFGA